MPQFISESTAFSEHSDIADETELLTTQCHHRLHSFLSAQKDLPKTAPADTYIKRLKAELALIQQQAVCSYFLIVADYVQWAKDQGIAVGPGRGSGPCSLVGFVLGITAVDPLEHDLPFERFIDPERDVLPDFDIDFCQQRRNEVIDYLRLKYGTDRVAHISNEEIAPRFSRLVICNRPLTTIAPLYQTADTSCPAIEMTVAQTSEAGLVRFNVINQIALTIIQHTTQQLAMQGVSVDVNKLPMDDPEVYPLLCAGEPSNISVLDNGTYHEAIKIVQPTQFTELYAAVALSLPRLQWRLPQFSQQLHGTNTMPCFHPALESITRNTFSLVLFQEQLMSIAHEIAGFSLARGDLFRRALQQADQPAIRFFRTRFIIGANQRGLSGADAAGLFEYLAMYGNGYANKSHAIAFAVMAYQAAWLSVKYPDTYSTVKSQVINNRVRHLV